MGASWWYSNYIDHLTHEFCHVSSLFDYIVPLNRTQVLHNLTPLQLRSSKRLIRLGEKWEHMGKWSNKIYSMVDLSINKSLLNLGVSNSEKAFNAVARRNRMNRPEHAVTFASAGMCKTMVPTRTSWGMSVSRTHPVIATHRPLASAAQDPPGGWSQKQSWLPVSTCKNDKNASVGRKAI